MRGRITREMVTLEAMVRLFCRQKHRSKDLCSECSGLLDYAAARLENCPFGTEKPTCRQCPVHCYSPVMRQRIIGVMRYAGPRMLLSHPVLAFWHIRDEFGRRSSLERRQV